MKIYSGHYLKSSDEPNDVVIECESHGCDKACKFYNGQQTIVERKYSPIHNQEYTLTTMSSLCLKINDVGRRREEIYSKADKAAEEIPYTFGGGIIQACNKKKQVFNDIIENEYINAPCPFFQ